ncbi:abscisic acid 8'-hydroxylase CYP707A1-like [Diospyros lotus]|uniref:abscisic acid 8'-hydroxylase CYP707A1-like n=1 Tax=Diospyros lotus TaxID=55363 RepID=UPI0022518F2A|nr:abscisic acid 8'-hydroxylase CYP707A1-like [Diospyros lotus]
MAISVVCLHIFILLAIFFLSFLWYLKNQFPKPPRNRPAIPPGSQGLPFLGETLKLYSQSPSVFFGSRHERYGEIFKSHIHGSPCVMLGSPEAVKFALVTEAHLFKQIYPRSKEQLIGPWAVFFRDGEFHSRVRKLVQGSVSLEVIRRMVPAVESLAVAALESCCGDSPPAAVNTFHAMKKFTFEVAIILIFGQLDSVLTEKLREIYFTIDGGYNSFPINFPGTPFRRAFLARRRLGKILGEIISETREKRLAQKNLLSSLLNYCDEEEQVLSDDQITDNVVGVLFASQGTTASALAWVIKYIHDYPLLREAVEREQQAIYEANDGGRRPLTWDQTRNMPYTYKVVLETLRMATVLSYTYRVAVEDVEYKGMLIPKGWRVMPLFRIIHHNQDFFPESEKFDPSRFEAAQRPNTFLPFGSGIHACPGNEVAKLEILVLIHQLVTKFRYEVVGPADGVEYSPFPVPTGGLVAKFTKN